MTKSTYEFVNVPDHDLDQPWLSRTFMSTQYKCGLDFNPSSKNVLNDATLLVMHFTFDQELSIFGVPFSQYVFYDTPDLTYIRVNYFNDSTLFGRDVEERSAGIFTGTDAVYQCGYMPYLYYALGGSSGIYSIDTI